MFHGSQIRVLQKERQPRLIVLLEVHGRDTWQGRGHEENEPPRLPRRGLAAADQLAVASVHRAAARQAARKEHPFDNLRTSRLPRVAFNERRALKLRQFPD
jgi:hypothetical protein